MNYGKSSKLTDAIKSQNLPRLSISELKRHGLTAVTAFLLGICPLPFSVYPLGVAFACAASSLAPSAFAGLAVAAFFTPQKSAVYLLSVAFALAWRILARLFAESEQIFSEALPLRVACAAVSVFALSIYPIIAGGFRYYDLFGAILSIFAAAAGVLLFYGAFSELKEHRLFSLYKKSAELAISALLCLSLASLPQKNFLPALTLAFVLTLNFCISRGLAESCLCAILCGAACGVENIPVLVIASLTAFCVLDVSPALAAAVSCISGSVCGIMISGSGYMTLPFLSLLLGCAAFTIQKKLAATGGVGKSAASSHEVLSQIRLECANTLLAEAQSSLRSLSHVFPHFGYADRLIESTKAEINEESKEDTRLSLAVSRRLYELGFGKIQATVTGRRGFTVRLYGERLAGNAERVEFIKRQTEAIIGFPLTRARLSEDGTSLTFFRESAISYHHSISRFAKESVCGDTAEVFFDHERNYLYAVICDGMGSGKEAGEVSSRAVTILKALLLAGLEPLESLTSLSSLLCEGGEKSEISTTVDLLRLDLYTGDGIVIKSGAAPSYLKRKNELKRLCARTVPMGILKIADAEEIKFKVLENDVIIMASDGVAEDEGESLPLAKYLSNHKASLPKEMANDIVELSQQNGKNDDLSVIAIKIFPQNY